MHRNDSFSKPRSRASFFWSRFKTGVANVWRSLRDVKFGVKFAIVTFVAVYATLFIISLTSSALRDWINTWPVATRYAASILFAVIFIMGGFAITMLLYLVIRRRKPRSKYMVEVITVAIVFLLSWIFKAITLAQVTTLELGPNYEPTFSAVTQFILSSLFATFGGLQFEGLAYEAVSSSVVYIAFYYGTSIIAGLIFISVIASKAAYEFYSRILLFFLRTKGKQIYIFTALNDETLNLASSLVEEDRDQPRHNKLIIFCGSALEPFDRHDPKCVEVMAHGYVYWSVSARKTDTILEKVGLHSPRHRLPNWESITVFAFDSDDDHIPNEEENMDFVLLDIHNRMERMRKYNRLYIERGAYFLDCTAAADTPEKSSFRDSFRKELEKEDGELNKKIEAAKRRAARRAQHLDSQAREDRLFDAKRRVERLYWQNNHLGDAHISYYILTKRKVDYQVYQDKIAKLEDEYYSLFSLVDAKGLLLRESDILSHAEKPSRCLIARAREAKPFSVHVWNEADAIAREAQDFVLSEKDGVIPDPKQTWMWSFGFGTTGQSLVKAVYCFSSYVDHEGNGATFLCDVFDPKSADSLVGLTRLEMPLSVCVSEPTSREDIATQYEQEFDRIFDQYYAKYPDLNFEEIQKCDTVKGFNVELGTTDELHRAMYREIPFPCFVFHSYAAGSEKMIPLLFPPKNAPEPSGRINPYQKYPNYVAVASGDDYTNIRVTNDLAAHFLSLELPHKITIFVAVWDEKNNNLVTGFNRQDASPRPQVIDFGKVRVIIIGNNEDIYSCGSILEDHRSIDYNYVYGKVSSRTYDQLGNLNKETYDFNLSAHLYFRTGGAFADVAIPESALQLASQKYTLRGAEYFAKSEQQWYGLTLWKRVSSADAYHFAPVYSHLFAQYDRSLSLNVFFTDLARIEHQRWTRKHIADGWRPMVSKNEVFKHHNCIAPMHWIDYHTICYDLYNVFMGIASQNPSDLEKIKFAKDDFNRLKLSLDVKNNNEETNDKEVTHGT